VVIGRALGCLCCITIIGIPFGKQFSRLLQAELESLSLYFQVFFKPESGTLCYD